MAWPVNRSLRAVALTALAATMLGCAAGARPAPRTHVEMTSLSASLSTRCRNSHILMPACPTLVPRVTGGLTVSGPTNMRSSGFAVFDLEHGAPHERDTRLNRPPGVLHLTIVGGPKPGNLFGGMTYPRARITRKLAAGLDRGARPKPLLLGTRHWGGHVGALFLAPSYPFGGQIGGHLTFWWRSGRDSYVVSLHAWEPLTECARVLRAIVASTG